MDLSQKKIFFSQIVSTFLKSNLNLQDFEKSDEPYSWFISEVKASVERG